LASLVRILEQTEAEREPNLRHKTTPVSLEKDPAGHGKQSAIEKSSAPAPQNQSDSFINSRKQAFMLARHPARRISV
jgi:hypothetical protein